MFYRQPIIRQWGEATKPNLHSLMNDWCISNNVENTTSFRIFPKLNVSDVILQLT